MSSAKATQLLIILASCLSLLGLTGCQVKVQPSKSTLVISPSPSPTVNANWALQIGAPPASPVPDATSYDYCADVATDGSGNSFCVGSTYGSIGSTNGGAPNPDAFVAKIDSSGRTVWIRQLGMGAAIPNFGAPNTAESDLCYSAAVDASGNIYCAGETEGALGAANAGWRDAFILKLNAAGEVQWVKQFGTAVADICYSVAVDDDGNVYCGGSTAGSLGEASGGSWDAFVVKLDPSGNQVWLKQFGATTKPGAASSGWENARGITVDSAGNVFVAGDTSSDFGEAHAGGGDAFILKLTSAGAISWITQLGASTAATGGDNTGPDICYSITLDPDGNVLCAGDTSGAIGEANGGGGTSDTFIMKVSGGAGALLWVTQLGAATKAPGGNNSNWDYCNDVVADANGNVYCAGYTGGSLAETTGGASDGFALKLNSSGALQWIRQFGSVTMGSAAGNSSADDSFSGIAIDSLGNIILGGSTESDFAGTSSGATDALVVRLSPDGTFGP